MLRILYTKYYFYTDFLICFYDFYINCFYWVIFIALHKIQFYTSEDLNQHTAGVLHTNLVLVT